MATSKEVTVKQNVGDQVIARVNSLSQVGFKMPADYQHINAIKASMLVLQDLKDKNGKPALEVCTQNSIASALFTMAIKGLDVSRKTAYFLVRGNQLCLHESYFGKVLQVKRIYPDFDPHPVVIREGDEFAYTIDPETGCKKLVKHEQKLENIDNDFVGAYMYLPTSKGGQDLFVMTKKQILTAWSKSSSREQTTHRAFQEKMVLKTVINSGCNMIINSTPDLAYASNEAGGVTTNDNEQLDHTDAIEAEFVEVKESNEVVDTQTGEVMQGQAAQEDDDF